MITRDDAFNLLKRIILMRAHDAKVKVDTER